MGGLYYLICMYKYYYDCAKVSYIITFGTNKTPRTMVGVAQMQMP